MVKLETNFDDLLGCNYSLYSAKHSDLKKEVESWYKDVNLKDFNNKAIDNLRYNIDYKVIRKAGLLSNLFYAYKENDKFYLLDGFSRLLTDYGDLDKDTIVYIKIIEDKLENHKLMSLMFNLNLWKLYHKNYGGFTLRDFLDRGFRLFLKSRFNIELYNRKTYDTRLRYADDEHLLEHYFINERDFSAEFKYDYKHVAHLFLNKNIINDFKDLIETNNYLEEPFRNYTMFLEGYARFLSWKRIKNDETNYKFKDFLELLYKDKKFFTKLQGMSGNDSTRKNIYKFFEQF
jgi:hypothetical protein